MSGPNPPGQIFTFYSYKGGTGRSMALANVGYLLASQVGPDGRGILVIDWDLEAPGLHRYFEERSGGRGRTKTLRLAEQPVKAPGLIDFLDLAQETYLKAEGGTNGSDKPVAESVLTEIRKSLFERFGEFVVPTGIENLSILRAGSFDSHYPERIRKFDWEQFHRKDPGFFRAFRHHLGQKYDFVLIDSRTGLTDTSGICVQQMPEKLVLVFVPNRQNLDGVVDVARRSARFRTASHDPRPLLIFPLASRIDGTNEYLRTVWRRGGTVGDMEIQGYQKIFQDLFVELYGLDECDLEGYFDATQLKHDGDYAYGERIAARKGTTERLSLGFTFADFTRRLVNLSAPWEALPAEVEIQEFKRREETASASEKVARRSVAVWKWTSALLGAVTVVLALAGSAFFKRQNVLTVAKNATDPLEQALLLTALDDFPPPWGGTELARQVANSDVPTLVLRGHTGPVVDVAFSPNGKQIATASTDGTARVWNADGTGRPQVLRGHTGPVVSVAWPVAGLNPNLFLLTASQDGNAFVWSGKQGKWTAEWRGSHPLRVPLPLLGALFGRGTGTRIIAVDPAGLSTAQFGDLQPVTGFKGRITSYGFDPERRFLVLSTSSEVQIWDTEPSNSTTPLNSTLEKVFRVKQLIPATAVALSSTADLLLTSSPSGTELRRIRSEKATPEDRGSWELGTVMPVTPMGEGTVEALVFGPEQGEFALGTSVGTAEVLGYSEGQILVRPVLHGHSGAVRALAFSPDGKQLATASDDKTVRVWNLELSVADQDLGWSGLLAYLRKQTTACLLAEERVRLLSESPSDAQERYAACEKSHGRVPP